LTPDNRLFTIPEVTDSSVAKWLQGIGKKIMNRKGYNSAIGFALGLMMFSGETAFAQSQSRNQIEIAQSTQQL
jgi:hypothetical protein